MSDTMFDAMFAAALTSGSGEAGFTPTEQQLTAINSGITATDVEQIATNKNNISSFHKAAGTDIYFSETEPTGTITNGSYWISASGIKKYTISANKLDYTTVQDHYNIDFSGYPVEYSTAIDDRCATVTPIDVSETDSITISYSSDNINIIYSLFNGSTLLGRVAGGSSPTTINTIGATALYICWYKTNTFIEKSDITNAMVNSGNSALPYVPYGGSWS